MKYVTNISFIYLNIKSSVKIMEHQELFYDLFVVILWCKTVWVSLKESFDVLLTVIHCLSEVNFEGHQ